MISGARVPAPSWRLPTEIAFALASPGMQAVLSGRRANGPVAKPTATVFQRGHDFFAVVDFEGPERPGLLFKLDAWAWENR